MKTVEDIIEALVDTKWKDQLNIEYHFFKQNDKFCFSTHPAEILNLSCKIHNNTFVCHTSKYGEGKPMTMVITPDFQTMVARILFAMNPLVDRVLTRVSQ